MTENKKKVGIITINNYDNFGNRLQNYASQQTLKNMGFEVDTIIVKLARKNKIVMSKLINKIIKMSFGELSFRLINVFINKLYNDAHQRRKNEFVNFTVKHINEIDYGISNDIVPEGFSNQYDYFLCGSDQVWNPNYINGSSIYFLTFAEQSKRISYSASFGIPEISKEDSTKYTQYLKEMNQISVRENEGAEIVKELTGREATVLLDPTMMITKDEWLSIAKKSKSRPNEKYLLTYFLGYIPKRERERIRRIAKKNNLKIVNLMDVKVKDTFISGPSEFIDYTNNASLFCTNSFHGAVFSILLETPFIVFERETKTLSISTRIDTLLEKFKLEDRKWENMKNNNSIFTIDLSHIPAVLEIERKKSLDYLKNALGIKDIN